MKPSTLATVLIRLAALFLFVRALASCVMINVATSVSMGLSNSGLLIIAGGTFLFAIILWLWSPILGRIVASGLE